MASNVFVNSVQSLLRRAGYQLNKLPRHLPSIRRPLGDMPCFLEDLVRRGFQPRNILDVGGNKADWSGIAIQFFPDASYILIEPQHEMTTHLEQFCREHPNARHVQAGAGAVPGELILTVWDDLQGSSLLPSESEAAMEDKERRKVKIITIDSLYEREADLPDLVKLDIQGFELEALKGAQKLFGHTELFIVEVSLFETMFGQPLMSDVVGFMAQRGYEAYEIPGFMRRPFDAALGQIDIAFAAKDGFLRKSQQW